MTKPKKPECRPCYVCTKDGVICYITLDWDDARKYKAAFGCTIWSATVDYFKSTEPHKAQELS